MEQLREDMRRSGAEAADALPPGAARALRVALWLVAVAGLAVVAVNVVVHVDDRFLLGHVAGVWLTLARWAAEGRLYAPFFDGETWNATRYLPLSFLLHAGLAKPSGELVLSGRILNALYATVLLGVLAAGLRERRVPGHFTVLLLALVALAPPVFDAFFRIRHDALPAALQLGAVFLVARRAHRRALVAAAVLCAAALLAKLSAVWGAGSIGLWLLVRDRRGLALFAATWMALAGAGFAAFEGASDGRMSGALLAAFGGGAFDPWTGPGRLVVLLRHHARELLVLAPFATASLLFAAAERRPALPHVALVVATATTLVVLGDEGTWRNHLVDLTPLLAWAVGDLWVRAARPAGALVPGRVVMALFVAGLAVLRLGTDRDLLFRDLLRPHPLNPYARWIGPADADEPLLSGNPSVAALAGRRPVVLDPFAFRGLGRRRPEWRRLLVERIERGDYDPIILRERLDEPEPIFRPLQFGEPVWESIERRYELVASTEDAHFYRPRPAPAAASKPRSGATLGEP